MGHLREYSDFHNQRKGVSDYFPDQICAQHCYQSQGHGGSVQGGELKLPPLLHNLAVFFNLVSVSVFV